MTSNALADTASEAIEHDKATKGDTTGLARTYDLMPKMMPQLDRHLIFPLLEFMTQQEAFPAEELLQSTYELLKPTNMMDYVASLWKQIHHSETIPEEFAAKRESVLQELKNLKAESAKILELLDDKDVISSLRQDKMANLQFLKDNHGVRTSL